MNFFSGPGFVLSIIAISTIGWGDQHLDPRPSRLSGGKMNGPA